MHLNRFARIIIFVLVFAAAPGVFSTASAQAVTTLIDFDTVWRYDQSGTDLGTAWREAQFDDSGWTFGPGLFQGGEDTAYPVAFGTVIDPPGGKVTHYFRTTFVGPSLATGLQIFATNFVDDGCVFWLNGVEAGRLRMPAGEPLFSTIASGVPFNEGQVDLITLDPSLVRPHQLNTLAVEVHQASLSSSDVVWGTKLVAVVPLALTLTRQPQSQVAVAGESVTFSTEVAGSPAFYQWQKDEVNILNATNSTFTIPSVVLAAAGVFRVIVTNAVNRVVSSNAVLTVLPDTRGPVMVSAILLNDPAGRRVVEVTFDELLASSSVKRDNLRLIRSGTFGVDAVVVTITNLLFGGRVVRLQVGNLSLDEAADYYVLANNVTDSRGNVIAPMSVFPVTIQGRVGLVPTNGPAGSLRLMPTLLPGNPPRLQLSWPSNANDVYYGYVLKETKGLSNAHPVHVFSVVSNQANGVIIRATDAARFYQLERGPNSGR